MITEKQAVESIKAKFAYYGFVASPLSDKQIAAMYSDYSDDEIYRVGCDVAAGYPIAEAIAALESE